MLKNWHNVISYNHRTKRSYPWYILQCLKLLCWKYTHICWISVLFFSLFLCVWFVCVCVSSYCFYLDSYVNHFSFWSLNLKFHCYSSNLKFLYYSFYLKFHNYSFWMTAIYLQYLHLTIFNTSTNALLFYENCIFQKGNIHLKFFLKNTKILTFRGCPSRRDKAVFGKCLLKQK